ncbi:hypothetical protein [Mucilaginibacter polytrichastri]|uniref:Uncharacterized protein n=1 Tax=Mucilaginibacter polytrichastri TaxID=1302689 RepID=A0A1Q6A2D3_9SPHI|nr:hypothetical protein [Mucilaginibacter polytrichastri]OKS88177.1 hypothetical protein RG47T_3641 [Mucilaginibacter polytrichastri]SFT08843.1 hypothetical protein SAMN04487890_11065 [Mucilaginibacter polytrichastri]
MNKPQLKKLNEATGSKVNSVCGQCSSRADAIDGDDDDGGCCDDDGGDDDGGGGDGGDGDGDGDAGDGDAGEGDDGQADDDDDDDDDDNPGTGITSGDIVYIDQDGNQYVLPKGGTYTLDDGQVVTISDDGTVQNTTLPTVTVSATITPSTGEVFLSAFTLGADIQSTTFSGVQLATEGIEVLENLGSGFGVASIIAGGFPSAVNIIISLYNGQQISLKDAVNVFFAVIAALGLYFGISEFVSFVLALGATINDVIQAMN